MLPLRKHLLQILFAILLVAPVARWISPPLLASASTQGARHSDLSDFLAMLANQGVAIEWQANGTSVDWRFTLYRSQNCQFDGAEEVSAPIFSSINDEKQIAHYSLTDVEAAALATCAYWLVATQNNGEQIHFGPYQVQGRSIIYLPLASR